MKKITSQFLSISVIAVAALCLSASVAGFAQEKPEPKPETKPVLTENDILKSEKLVAQFDSAQKQITILQYQLQDAQRLQDSIRGQYADLNTAVLKDRKLDAKDFTVDWQTRQIVSVTKPSETAPTPPSRP